MAYNKKADENYRKKIDRMAIKYSISEQPESERLRIYLAQTGQSANGYIKGLIKRDLDEKGIVYPDSMDMDWYRLIGCFLIALYGRNTIAMRTRYHCIISVYMDGC